MCVGTKESRCLCTAAPFIPRPPLTEAFSSLDLEMRALLRIFGRLRPPLFVRDGRMLPSRLFRLPWNREQTMFSSPASHQRAGGGRSTLQERVPCDCVTQSLFARAPAQLQQPCARAREEGTQLVQNAPARLPDASLGARVGLPGRRQPAGYGTSWSGLVSGASGRPFPSSTDLLLPFFSTNLQAAGVSVPPPRSPGRPQTSIT